MADMTVRYWLRLRVDRMPWQPASPEQYRQAVRMAGFIMHPALLEGDPAMKDFSCNTIEGCVTVGDVTEEQYGLALASVAQVLIAASSPA